MCGCECVCERERESECVCACVNVCVNVYANCCTQSDVAGLKCHAMQLCAHMYMYMNVTTPSLL